MCPSEKLCPGFGEQALPRDCWTFGARVGWELWATSLFPGKGREAGVEVPVQGAEGAWVVVGAEDGVEEGGGEA